VCGRRVNYCTVEMVKKQHLKMARSVTIHVRNTAE